MQTETTLFERLGEEPGITKLVDDTVQAHMENPAINARFLPYLQDPEKLAGIKKHTVDFFSAGSGGACCIWRQRHGKYAYRYEYQSR